jgi:hypothetical protein
MKIYEMLRKKATCSIQVNTLYYLIKAMIYGFYYKISNLYTTIIAELYAGFIHTELQHCNMTYLIKTSVTRTLSNICKNTKKFARVP